MKLKQFACAACCMLASLPLFGSTADDPLNPVMWADVPDVSVMRHGDSYYMTSTTMHMNPGVPVMKSKDLINWEIVSYCYDDLMEDDLDASAKDRISLNNGQNEYGTGTWASCIRFYKGKFYISTFSPTTGKTYIFSSESPEKGDWKRISFRPSMHDHSLIFDKDDRVYMVSQAGDRRITELKSDLTGLKEGSVNKVLLPMRETAAAMGLPGKSFLMEGSQMHIINGKYYLINIAWPPGGIRTVVCSRADNLLGPYEAKVLFSCEGIAQGGLVDTPDGKWYALLFGDRGGVGRIPYLAPVVWKDGWPLIGDNNGKDLPKLKINVKKDAVPGCVASDEFNRKTGDRPLPLVWQWNHIPVKSLWSVSARPGFLRLTAGEPVPVLERAKNSLTQRVFGPVSTAEIAMDISKMKDGDYAGLAAFQSRYGFVGVKQVDGRKFIVMGTPGNANAMTEKASVPFNGKTAYFRVECDLRVSDPGRTNSDLAGRSDKSYFYYSLDGKTWTRIGDSIDMPYSMPHFMGYRFAIFNFATKTAGGIVDVDYYRIGTKLTAK